LRFSGFSEDWHLSTISNIATKVTDGTHDTPKPVPSGIPYLTAIHIKDGTIDYDNCYFLPEEEHKKIYKRCNPEKGDLLLVNIGAGTAVCAMNTVDYEFSLKNVALIKPNRKLISPEFLAQYQRKNSLKLFNQITTGGAQPFLSLSEIGKIKVIFPQLPEQTKIANFLTAIDEKLSQLTQKCELLTQYKKGVMQKIFSQELRFKDDDGQDFPEWEDKALSDVGKSFNGLVGKSGDDFGSGKSYITYKQIFDSSKIDVSKFSFVEIGENEKQNRVRLGDIFFTTSSETPSEVGFCSVLLSEVNDVYLNSFCFGYRVDSFEKLSPLFAQFLFHISDFREDVIKLAQGSTRYNISKISFMEIRIQLPCIHEQTKIANFLTVVDEKITATQTQLKAVKQYKQGLLQQMFV
jgi:type I restriction enzyme S subunit